LLEHHIPYHRPPVPLHVRLNLLLMAYSRRQDEIAGELGVTRGAVNHYLTGRRTPSPEMVRRIEDAILGRPVQS
jgi:transcriptional regulator with XRE-family HTH domain